MAMDTSRRQVIREVVEYLKQASLEEVLGWAVDTFGNDLGMTTAFGYSGVFLIHKLIAIKPDIDIFFIDTVYHFPETIEFAHKLQQKWYLNLHIVHPLRSKCHLEKEIGKPPYNNEKDHDRCCYRNKVEPLLSFINLKTSWLSAIRRDQAVTRSGIDILQIDQRGILKIHPLYKWTSDRIWDYIRTHDLPYNPLHDSGYMSIGCQPCTHPVTNAVHEREGRWPQSGKVECGINCFTDNV